MLTKERMLAAIRVQPVDRLPFWPKLTEAYSGLQVDPFCNMNNNEINTWIGSDWQETITQCTKEKRKNTSVEVLRYNDTEKVIFKSKSGSTEGVSKFDFTSMSWHPVKNIVENNNDIRIITECFNDCTIELDTDKLEQAKHEEMKLGQSALSADIIGRTPLMDFVNYYAGIENAHYLLTDYKEEVEELFEAMQKVLIRKVEILCEYSPADVLYLQEDTSSSLISPSQFRTYCMNQIQQCESIIEASSRIYHLHMCGHLRDILPDLSTLKASSFEAFTSPPIGNTNLIDGRNLCPEKCLIGGTNATLWMQPVKNIIEKIEKSLAVLPHHRGLIISSAGVMPPMVKPQKIKEVFEWLKNYKLRL